jgi:hypothetical protein
VRVVTVSPGPARPGAVRCAPAASITGADFRIDGVVKTA